MNKNFKVWEKSTDLRSIWLIRWVKRPFNTNKATNYRTSDDCCFPSKTTQGESSQNSSHPNIKSNQTYYKSASQNGEYTIRYTEHHKQTNCCALYFHFFLFVFYPKSHTHHKQSCAYFSIMFSECFVAAFSYFYSCFIIRFLSNSQFIDLFLSLHTTLKLI